MEQLGISKLDLKRQNRMQILKILKQQGPTSRIDMAGILEITRAAVTIITNEMINQGVIVELGEYKQVAEVAPRGRKKILLDINQNFKFSIGVTIEENQVCMGISNIAGDTLDKSILKTNDEVTFNDVCDFINATLKELLSVNCLNEENILGIGIGIIPSMYRKMGISVCDGLTDSSKLKKEIAKFTNVTVVVDNYIKGAAMANIDFQKEKDPNRHNIAFLSYGNVYHFVVTNLNEPIISYDNRTDFVDKIIINPEYRWDNSGPIRKGSVKAELTPLGCKMKVQEIFSKEKTPYLYEVLEGDIDNLNAENFQDAIKNGDTEIEKIKDTFFELLCVLVNNLIYSTNPQRLVLHDFPFTDEEYLKFKMLLEKIIGKNISDMVDVGSIQDKNRFLAGSAIAIRELFFLKGGI